MPTHTQLYGVTDIGKPLTSEKLETNLVAFFQWGLLGAGNFYNITLPTSGAYDGSPSRLRLSEDPNYNAGQIWEGYRSDWVWESGIEYPYQPIRVSGVYVNGTFHSISETGVYKHTINYPMGRVVFDAAIPTNSVVNCEYSHRFIHFTHSDVPWWRRVQQDSLRVDNPQFLQYGSGDWSVLSDHRVQLPAVIVDAIPESTKRGMEIGHIKSITNQTVLFHILTETPWDRKKLHDIITNQWNKTIHGFQIDAVIEASGWPLDENGSPVGSGRMYPDLVKDTGPYFWQKIYIPRMTGEDPQGVTNTGPIYYCTVRAGVELNV